MALFGSEYLASIENQFKQIQAFNFPIEPAFPKRSRRSTASVKASSHFDRPRSTTPRFASFEPETDKYSVNEDIWNLRNSWEDIDVSPEMPGEPEVAFFKQTKMPTMNLSNEFNRNYDRAFDLEYQQSLFDLFLDDLGEKDVKLLDYDSECDDLGLRKYGSIIRDSTTIVN
jgi:hypothetical protein